MEALPSSKAEAPYATLNGESGESIAAAAPHDIDVCLIKETDKGHWDLLVMLLIIYSAVAVPLRLCFRAKAEGAVWAFEATMSLVFVADLALSFNTAYLVEGEWVMDRRMIARRYFAGWFWIDAPASVPVELIELLIPDSSSNVVPALRLLRLLRLVRMLRLLKIGIYIAHLEEQLEINLRPLRVAELVVMMLMVSHFLACGWFLTTWINDDDDEGSEQEASPRWIDHYDDGSAADGPLSRQYYLAYYWALVTVTSKPPYAPVNDTERNFQMATYVFNRLFFAYIISKISSLVIALDRQKKVVEDKMDVIREYLHWRGTPKELSIRIKRYYEFFYEKDATHLDEGAILRGLSPSLHSELVYSITKDTLGRVPLFQKLTPEFQAQIFPLIKPQTFAPGERIFACGSVSHTLYFLLEGQVDLLSERDGLTPARRLRKETELILSYPQAEELCTLDSIGCFGQEVLIGSRRRNTAVAFKQAEVVMIEKKHLLQIFKATGLDADLRRLSVAALEMFISRERLRSVKAKIARTVAHNTGDFTLSAALGLQIQWRRFVQAEAFKHDELYKLCMSRAKQHAKRLHKGAAGDAASASGGASQKDCGEDDGRGGQEGPRASDPVAIRLDDLQRKQDDMHATLQALVVQLQQPLARGAQSARSK